MMYIDAQIMRQFVKPRTEVEDAMKVDTIYRIFKDIKLSRLMENCPQSYAKPELESVYLWIGTELENVLKHV